MKYLLRTVLLIVPILLVAQTPQGINYQAVAYDANGFEIANQEISIRLGILLETADAESSYTETHQITTNDFGLFSLVISEGTTTEEFSTLNWENGAFLKIELDANLDGNYTLMGINSFNSVPYSIHSLHSTFAENIPTYYSEEIEGLVSDIDSLQNIVDIVSQYFGCKDHDACNYDATATMSNNSCTYAQEGYYCSGECIDTDGDMVCDLDEVEGCTDATACNYILGATNEDNSCIYQEAYYNCQGDCENDDDGDGICDELEQGCTDEIADNYNPQALSNSSACIFSGCMDNTSGNYNPMANQDDDSCIPAEACPYPEYLEYDSTAASYSEELCLTLVVYGCTDYTALNYDSQANADDGTCQNIYGCTDNEADNYNLEATTNDESCIYYGCINPESGNYDETANTDNGTCLIGGCMNATAENYNPDAVINDGACIIYGCTLNSFPNYNSVASNGDSSCDMNSLDVYGCTDELTWSYQDFVTVDNGSCYQSPQIGKLAIGGIVFYIDETGEHGLVAAMEDLEGTYVWGCYGTSIDGADGAAIGTGLQNTLEIVAGCSDTNTAAFQSLNFTTENYTDWYLPSIDELAEMNNIFGLDSDIGNFQNDYWSSSEYSYYGAWSVTFPNGPNYKDHSLGVRVVRAF